MGNYDNARQPLSQHNYYCTSICLFTIMVCGSLSGVSAHWQKIEQLILSDAIMHTTKNMQWSEMYLYLSAVWSICIVLKYFVGIRCCTCNCEGFKVLVLKYFEIYLILSLLAPKEVWVQWNLFVRVRTLENKYASIIRTLGNGPKVLIYM